MDTDYVADMFRAAGIKNLFYLGYHSNQCLLSRSLGVPAMQARGFDTILVRDASAAKETSDSISGEWFHRAAVHLVEINGARTTTVADIQAAAAAALARD
jgi:nicotinamidase-related amidase